MSIAGIGLGHHNIRDNILCFSLPFTHSHTVDAIAPGISSSFQVDNRGKGWCQMHLFHLLKKKKKNQGFPKSQAGFCLRLTSQDIVKNHLGLEKTKSGLVFPVSRAETAPEKRFGMGGGKPLYN